MPDFILTAPDGAKYKVTADTPEQAASDFKGFRQQEMNQAFMDEAKNASFLGSFLPAARDVGRVGLDAVTLGGADTLADYMQGTDTEAMMTKAAKNRMGWAGTALETGAIAGALPTAVPKVVAKVGGGPAVRTGTTALTGGVEGTTLGATNAYLHDEDPTTGGIIGGATGILGPLAGSLINKGTRKAKEWWYGQSYDPPKYNVTALGKNPDRMQRVNVATTKAEDKARLADDPLGVQSAYRSEFSKLTPKQFTEPQRAELEKIVRGDFGTKATSKLGQYISDKLVAAGAMAGTGGLEGGLVAAGLTGGGNLLKRASLGGTKEAAQNLRRSVYGYPQPPAPVSPEAAARAAAVARQLGLEYGRSDEIPWLPGYWGR